MKLIVINQWEVPSDSHPDKTYRVTQYESGVWKCSCPNWIFRLQKTGNDCKHIVDAKSGAYSPGEHYPMIVAHIREVQLKDGKLLYPMIPMGWPETSLFIHTIMYDMLKQGQAWQDVREKFGDLFPRRLSKDDVLHAVESLGRCTLGVWVDGMGFMGFERKELER